MIEPQNATIISRLYIIYYGKYKLHLPNIDDYTDDRLKIAKLNELL